MAKISDKAKYCSDKCRMAFTRTNKLVQPEQIQPEQIKDPEQMTPNKQPEQMTEDQKRIGKVIKGYCHGCGKDFTTLKGLMLNDEYMDKERADRTCICLHCVKAGISHDSLRLDVLKCG